MSTFKVIAPGGIRYEPNGPGSARTIPAGGLLVLDDKLDYLVGTQIGSHQVQRIDFAAMESAITVVTRERPGFLGDAAVSFGPYPEKAEVSHETTYQPTTGAGVDLSEPVVDAELTRPEPQPSSPPEDTPEAEGKQEPTQKEPPAAPDVPEAAPARRGRPAKQ